MSHPISSSILSIVVAEKLAQAERTILSEFLGDEFNDDVEGEDEDDEERVEVSDEEEKGPVFATYRAVEERIEQPVSEFAERVLEALKRSITADEEDDFDDSQLQNSNKMKDNLPVYCKFLERQNDSSKRKIDRLNERILFLDSQVKEKETYVNSLRASLYKEMIQIRQQMYSRSQAALEFEDEEEVFSLLHWEDRGQKRDDDGTPGKVVGRMQQAVASRERDFFRRRQQQTRQKYEEKISHLEKQLEENEEMWKEKYEKLEEGSSAEKEEMMKKYEEEKISEAEDWKKQVEELTIELEKQKRGISSLSDKLRQCDSAKCLAEEEHLEAQRQMLSYKHECEQLTIKLALAKSMGKSRNMKRESTKNLRARGGTSNDLDGLLKKEMEKLSKEKGKIEKQFTLEVERKREEIAKEMEECTVDFERRKEIVRRQCLEKIRSYEASVASRIEEMEDRFEEKQDKISSLLKDASELQDETLKRIAGFKRLETIVNAEAVVSDTIALLDLKGETVEEFRASVVQHIAHTFSLSQYDLLQRIKELELQLRVVEKSPRSARSGSSSRKSSARDTTDSEREKRPLGDLKLKTLQKKLKVMTEGYESDISALKQNNDKSRERNRELEVMVHSLESRLQSIVDKSKEKKSDESKEEKISVMEPDIPTVASSDLEEEGEKTYDDVGVQVSEPIEEPSVQVQVPIITTQSSPLLVEKSLSDKGISVEMDLNTLREAIRLEKEKMSVPVPIPILQRNMDDRMARTRTEKVSPRKKLREFAVQTDQLWTPSRVPVVESKPSDDDILQRINKKLSQEEGTLTHISEDDFNAEMGETRTENKEDISEEQNEYIHPLRYKDEELGRERKLDMLKLENINFKDDGLIGSPLADSTTGETGRRGSEAETVQDVNLDISEKHSIENLVLPTEGKEIVDLDTNTREATEVSPDAEVTEEKKVSFGGVHEMDVHLRPRSVPVPEIERSSGTVGVVDDMEIRRSRESPVGRGIDRMRNMQQRRSDTRRDEGSGRRSSDFMPWSMDSPKLARGSPSPDSGDGSAARRSLCPASATIVTLQADGNMVPKTPVRGSSPPRKEKRRRKVASSEKRPASSADSRRSVLVRNVIEQPSKDDSIRYVTKITGEDSKRGEMRRVDERSSANSPYQIVPLWTPSMEIDGEKSHFQFGFDTEPGIVGSLSTSPYPFPPIGGSTPSSGVSTRTRTSSGMGFRGSEGKVAAGGFRGRTPEKQRRQVSKPTTVGLKLNAGNEGSLYFFDTGDAWFTSLESLEAIMHRQREKKKKKITASERERKTHNVGSSRPTSASSAKKDSKNLAKLRPSSASLKSARPMSAFTRGEGGTIRWRPGSSADRRRPEEGDGRFWKGSGNVM